MTRPDDPDNQSSGERVELSKSDSAGEEPFDPYRFGKPDHPIPAEYAPPGYTGPVIPTAPPQTPGWGPPPPGGNPTNPFSNPPGMPYATPGESSPPGYPPHQAPYPYPPMPSSGYYPPPPGYGYGQPRPGSNGKAITALILGIGSMVFCFFSFFDALLVIPGLIFGIIAMNETKATGGTGRGMAVAGVICSVVGAVLATIMSVLLIHAANQCGGFDSGNDPSFQNCVQDHIF